MSLNPRSDPARAADSPSRDVAEAPAFGERDAVRQTKDPTTATAAGESSTSQPHSNLKSNNTPTRDDPRRDAGNMHVTFDSVDEAAGGPAKRSDYANLHIQANSGSFGPNNNNNSFFTNGSILRNASGLLQAGVGGDNPPASSPLQLLYQSFANPISDAQAIENAVRETLGQHST
ncbi:hypothetical protein ABB37_05343 [Leptomonas pyrrhocoris]|uniref:Uncharacterized protein n=1 Tax=Leptomonas pyrrhocoris TaxID=157538 RepID=A0A0M9FZU8_LEPPY|nr:hypothetical protein ABB37_05343 [Leptomonas pyrrhocoris]XP_015657959.1 hypothetical protein ABB37_05343 [Leptomonas pyrrhocoris]KPA79519.1 hypothetical protein ABB37_05343 [Leptomonas pyrrhocoris]KPA79520.1 hypothetical protein ABB37_05343 [Leptomonas pyrrhocoris]|eukprot:XP_015657958.1 hypothetical protein ABB37_05343 [Leptomonas pyrrhocoris]